MFTLDSIKEKSINIGENKTIEKENENRFRHNLFF